MNIDTLLNRYFGDASSLPTIEVFDNDNIYDVYVDIVKTLKNSPDIELGVLQLLSYCFYEILDNVLTHSGKKTGTVLMYYEPERSSIKILVADDGMGFGLYSTICLIKNAGIVMEIHSGQHLLRTDGETEQVNEAPLWQGTIIYFELHTDREIDPNSILENRADAESEFNETFIDTSDLDELW